MTETSRPGCRQKAISRGPANKHFETNCFVTCRAESACRSATSTPSSNTTIELSRSLRANRGSSLLLRRCSHEGLAVVGEIVGGSDARSNPSEVVDWRKF